MALSKGEKVFKSLLHNKHKLEILLGCLPFSGTVLLHRLLRSTLILLKVLYLLAIHILHHIICLPFLETESRPLMTVIFVIRLILVIFHLYELRVNRIRIQ